MSIAKSAPSDSGQVVPQAQTTTPINNMDNYMGMGVALDLFRFFNIDVRNVENDTVSKLVDINKWAVDGLNEVTVGNIIQKISSLERVLGSPHIGEKRWDKLHNWVRISNIIKDLEKQRTSLVR